MELLSCDHFSCIPPPWLPGSGRASEGILWEETPPAKCGSWYSSLGMVGSKSCLSSPFAWGVILGTNNRLHGGWWSSGCLTNFCLNSVISSEQCINRCCLIIDVYCAKGLARDEACLLSFYGWKAGSQSLYVRSLHMSIKPHQEEDSVLLGPR